MFGGGSTGGIVRERSARGATRGTSTRRSGGSAGPEASPRLTLTRYGHVIDEFEDRPRIEAEAVIADARQAVGTGGSVVVQDLGS